MEDPDVLRREIQAGLDAAGLQHSAVSRKLGRSKDYIGDFLRGTKATLGHTEILAIREMIAMASTARTSFENAGSEPMQSRGDIHIELAAFRENLFATLRTSGVPAVLARSRIDDLLEDLRAISSTQPPRQKAGSLRIYAESRDPEDGDPS